MFRTSQSTLKSPIFFPFAAAFFYVFLYLRDSITLSGTKVSSKISGMMTKSTKTFFNLQIIFWIMLKRSVFPCKSKLAFTSTNEIISSEKNHFLGFTFLVIPETQNL